MKNLHLTKEEYLERKRKVGRESAARHPETSQRWSKENPDKRREVSRNFARRITKKQRIDSRYSSGADDHFNEQLQKQECKCAVCEKPVTAKAHRDHNHACCRGRSACSKCWRGRLCHGCNLGLGFIERGDWLEKAQAYLHKWRMRLA